MKLRILAVATAAVLVLAGCGGPSDDGPADSPKPSPTVAAGGASGGGSQAGSSGECSAFSHDELISFVMFSQFLGQTRTVSALGTLSQLGYDPDTFAAMLDNLDQLKGVESVMYGTPDEGLANFRKANEIFGEILAKGEAASDADFAPVAQMWPSNDVWIKQQAAITGALNVVCPDLA